MRAFSLATFAVVLAAAVLAVLGVSTPAQGDTADRCRIAGQGITLTGAGKPILHFSTYSCPTSNFAFHVKAWCVKAFPPAPWTMCANTTVYDVHGNGNKTFSVPVGNGSWGCSVGPEYNTEAEVWDPDTATWVSNIAANSGSVC